MRIRKHRRVGHIELADIIDMYEKGKSIYSIARKHKRADSTIYNVLVRTGVHRKGGISNGIRCGE